jgi:L-aminopeptidase/D-esterase-like protein
MKILNNTLTDIPGIKVGHATHIEGATGCTVVICPSGTVGGVDVRGGGPGTRETDLLHPTRHVEHISAVLLSGGSAFGLAAADGVMRYLEEHDIGYKTIPGFVIPIVPTAIVFDLMIGQRGIRPDAEMGYAACEAATSEPVQQGNVGAGTGCTVGKMRGPEFATKSGIGSASMAIDDNLIVAALVAVNAVGDVIDEQGQIMAGLREPPDGNRFSSTMEVIKKMTTPAVAHENTVIGVVATNAQLSKAHVNKVAQMSHDGIARAVNPAHTMMDGDTIFALATGEISANVNVVGAYAAHVTASAIRNAIRAATSLAGVRAWND